MISALVSASPHPSERTFCSLLPTSPQPFTHSLPWEKNLELWTFLHRNILIPGAVSCERDRRWGEASKGNWEGVMDATGEKPGKCYPRGHVVSQDGGNDQLGWMLWQVREDEDWELTIGFNKTEVTGHLDKSNFALVVVVKFWVEYGIGYIFL